MNQFKPLVFSTIVAVVFVLLTNKSCAQITADSSFNIVKSHILSNDLSTVEITNHKSQITNPMHNSITYRKFG